MRTIRLRAISLVVAVTAAAFGQVYSVKTIAGKPIPLGDGGAARNAILVNPASIAVSKSGQIFIADTGNSRIRVIETDGNIRTYLGTGVAGTSADGTPIATAQISNTQAIAIDAQGALYFGDSSRVRKVTSSTITTVAGSGTSGNAGEGGPATSARIGSTISRLSFDTKGRLLITDSSYHKVWRVETDGTITTIAGTGQAGFGGDGGTAKTAALRSPNAAIADEGGNIYIADSGNSRVRKVAPDGKISTYAGGGATYTNNTSATLTSLNYPYDLALEESGELLIKEYSVIRRVGLTGTITQVLTGITGNRFAISGARVWSLLNSSSGMVYQGSLQSTNAPLLIAGRQRFEGDDGKATDALLQLPGGLAVNTQGQIYIADTGNARIRRIDAAGTIRTVAGGGSATLASPSSMTFCPDGNLYFVDGSTLIKSLDANGTVATIAGNGSYVSSSGPLEGPPLSVPLGTIRGLACDTAGTLYFASNNFSYYVYRLPKGGPLSLLSEAGTFGLGGSAKPKAFGYIYDIGLYQGNVLVAESQRVWQVGADGQIAVLIGGGNQRPAAGTPAKQISVSSLRAFSTDSRGNLLFSAWDGYPPNYGQKVFRLESAGTVTPLAGGGATFVEGGEALAASSRTINALVGLSGDRITYEDDSRIRMLEPVTATAVTVHSGDKQKAAPGARAANPVVAKVVGGLVPIPGVEVTFTATPSDVRVAPSKAMTDSQGLAAVMVTMGAAEGEVKVTASSGGLTPAVFTLTAEIPKPSVMNITRGDKQSVYAGTVASVPLEVILRTPDGTPAPGASVAFAVVSGEATLSAASVITGTDGKAAVTVKPTAAGTVVVEASSAGLAAVRFTLTVEAAPVMPAVRDYTVDAFAGRLMPEDGVAGNDAILYSSSYGLAFDGQGGLVFGDMTRQQILRLGTDGLVSVLAGQFGASTSADLDGSNARAATLYWPWSMATAPDGSVYFINRQPAAIYRLNSDGTLLRVVGTGGVSGGSSAENIQARQASTTARGLGFLPSGELVYSDYSTHQVRRVNASGTVTTLAGADRTAGFTGDGQPALNARLRNPDVLQVAPDGTIYFFDSGNYRVRAISPEGIIRTVAGNGSSAINGDGGSAVEAAIGRVYGMVLDREGNLLIAAGQSVRKIRPDGGIESLHDLTGRASVYALAISPEGLLHASVNLFPQDSGASTVRVVRFESDGSMTSLAGGSPWFAGEGVPALESRFYHVSSMAMHTDGTIYLTDDGNGRLRKIAPDGIVSTYAGGGRTVPEVSAVNAAELYFSSEYIALAPDGNLYFTDRVVTLGVVSPDGTAKLLYGTPNGRPRIESDLPAELTRFTAVTADSQSNLYFAASDNQNSWSAIYRRSPAGELTLVAGKKDGKAPAAGVPALEAKLQYVAALAFNKAGTLCFGDARGLIYCIDKDGNLSHLAGDISGTRTEGAPAAKFRFANIASMVFDSENNLVLSDGWTLLKFAPGGGVAVVAGSLSELGNSGDGGPAAAARFSYISAIVIDAGGAIYASDSNAMRIRKLTPAGK